MTTTISIAAITLFVSIIGIAGMLVWRWIEDKKEGRFTYIRALINRIDQKVIAGWGGVIVYLNHSARRLARGTFMHLPDALFEFSWAGCRTCRSQYLKLLITVRGDGDRKQRKEASSYMRTLGEMMSSDGKNQDQSSNQSTDDSNRRPPLEEDRDI